MTTATTGVSTEYGRQWPGVHYVDQHRWARSFVGWNTAFGVLLGLAAVVAVLDRRGTGRLAAELGLIAALAVWYAVFGTRGLRQRPASGAWYVAGAAVLVAAAYGIDPNAALLLFGVYSQIWAMLPFRRATVATAGLSVALGVVAVAVLGTSPGVALLESVINLGFSLVLGCWIGQIIRQSHSRAEIIRQLEETRAELAAVSHDAGVLTERARLAREIHDTLAQGFTSVLMLLEVADTEVDTDTVAARRHLALAREAARQNLAEARSMVAALTPVDLQAASLPEAVGRLVEQFGHELGVAAVSRVVGEPRPLPASSEVVLLRCAQEALANVRKHADARNVTVSLRYTEDGPGSDVVDDGRGFVLDGRPAGFGLAGMRSRVEQAGGSLSVHSGPNRGTTVRVGLP